MRLCTLASWDKTLDLPDVWQFCVTSGYSTIVRVMEYATQPLSGWRSMLLNCCLGDGVCCSIAVGVTEYVTQPLSRWQSMLLNHCPGDRVCCSTVVGVTEYVTQPLSGWHSVLLNHCPGDRGVCTLEWFPDTRLRVHKLPARRTKLSAHSYLNTFWVIMYM